MYYPKPEPLNNEMPSLEDLCVEFSKRSIKGYLALKCAEQKYADLLRDKDLPYEIYIEAITRKEGC